jgi:hypothetical protein
LALTSKLEELSVQLANKKGHPKPTNQWPNTWCGNYKGYGHLTTECPSPQLVHNAIDNKCGYSGKNHPMLKCWHLQAVMEIIPNKPTNEQTSWDVSQVNANMGPIPPQQNWH